jgi:hypothetical protein
MEGAMRFLVGVIFGAALTVGAAYVHDNVNIGRDAPAASRPMIVNWDVLTGLWSSARNTVESASFGRRDDLVH